MSELECKRLLQGNSIWQGEWLQHPLSWIFKFSPVVPIIKNRKTTKLYAITPASLEVMALWCLGQNAQFLTHVCHYGFSRKGNLTILVWVKQIC